MYSLGRKRTISLSYQGMGLGATWRGKPSSDSGKGLSSVCGREGKSGLGAGFAPITAASPQP